MHGLSPLALSFTAGLLAHAPALTALTNPTVNSYKVNLGQPRAISGPLGPISAHLGPSQATNPTLGSSKRLGARMTSSGATWCTDSRE